MLLNQNRMTEDQKKMMEGIPARKTVTLFVTLPCIFIAVIVLDKLSDYKIMEFKTTDKIVTGLGLTIAVTFEKTYSHAIQLIIEWQSRSMSEVMQIVCLVLACLGVLLTIIPAWLWYIVPLAIKPIPHPF